MTTAVGEREFLTYVKEASFGVLPPAPTMIPFWHNSESLNPNRGSFESGRSLGDHQVADFRLGRKSGQGDVTSELVYANFDDHFAGLLRTTKEATPAILSDVTGLGFTAPDTITDSNSNFILDGFAIGDYIFVNGATSGVNNGLYEILTVAAGTITVKEQTITTEAGPASGMTFRQCDFVNGVEQNTFAIQKHYLDIGIADHYLGSVISSGNLTVPANGIATMAWNWMCREYLSDQTPETTLATVPEYRPFDGLGGQYSEGGSPVAIMTAFNASVEHSVEFTEPLGTDIGGEVVYRKFRVSGSASFYFNTPTMMTKFWDQTETQFITSLVDPEGNTYIVGFPRVILTSGARPKSDDGPLMDQFNWTAVRSVGAQKSIYVVKIPV